MAVAGMSAPRMDLVVNYKIMGAEDTVLSYRIISHLLLGIVRIYSRKVEYLEYDSDRLLSKLQQQFGRCRGSTNAMFGPPSTITIPKQLQLDAFNLDIVVDESRDYMSNIEDITIQEQAEEAELHSRDQLVGHIYRPLHQNFHSIKHGKEEEVLKLSHISAGKTKGESALLFYGLHYNPEIFCYYGPCYAPCRMLYNPASNSKIWIYMEESSRELLLTKAL